MKISYTIIYIAVFIESGTYCRLKAVMFYLNSYRVAAEGCNVLIKEEGMLKRYSLLFLLLIALSGCSKDTKEPLQNRGEVSVIEKSDKDELNIVTFATDPPAADPLHAFDPDSYELISQIFDPLVYFGYDGNIEYGLATEWKKLSPTTIQFRLRKGVTFHNGEPFNAQSVKGTFELQADPATKSPTQGILNSIKSVDIIDDYTVNINTFYPDGMLLYRMHMFGSIVPPQYIKEKGLDYFYNHPVGTGPFKFVAWNRGKNIILEKNTNYWKSGVPRMKRVIFNVLGQDSWVENLIGGSIDFCMYLSGKDALLIEKNQGTRIMKRLVLSSYWVLMKNSGPLADIRVRKALNMAVNREELIKYAEYGNGEPMASLGKKGEFGYNAGLIPYEYDVDKAKQLLNDAGYGNGFALKVLVSDISRRVAENMKMQFKDIDVTLNLEIVSRPDWAMRIPQAKMTTGKADFDGDMTINLVDNPIYNLGFHAFIFLHSTGPFSITSDKDLDKKIEWAIATDVAEEHEERLQELDKYIHDNAFIVSTYQRILTPGMQQNVFIPKINLNAHLDYNMLQEAVKEQVKIQ